MARSRLLPSRYRFRRSDRSSAPLLYQRDDPEDATTKQHEVRGPADAGTTPMKILTKENGLTFALTALACAVAIIVVIPLWSAIQAKVSPAPSAPSTGGS